MRFQFSHLILSSTEVNEIARMSLSCCIHYYNYELRVNGKIALYKVNLVANLNKTSFTSRTYSTYIIIYIDGVFKFRPSSEHKEKETSKLYRKNAFLNPV